MLIHQEGGDQNDLAGADWTPSQIRPTMVPEAVPGTKVPGLKGLRQIVPGLLSLGTEDRLRSLGLWRKGAVPFVSGHTRAT